MELLQVSNQNGCSTSNPLHKKIQNAIAELLKDDYVHLYLEKSDTTLSSGQRVDIKGKFKATDEWHYFEIKTSSAKQSIREALGQILEYSHYDHLSTRAKKLFIIGPEKPDEKDAAYIKKLLCALEYCTDKSKGKIWALHREGRNMNRIRENGGYIDAPDDGRTDTKPSRDKAVDAPVIMFIQQNGAIVKDDNGENIGWNGAPFYWPVLMTQEKITPVMFALDQKSKGQTAVVDGSDFLEGIDPKEVLSLTYKGDLEEHFGPEGSEYEFGDCPWETRVLKQTTAGRYILRNEEGDWMIDPVVEFDEEHYHGIYSLNKEKFPFVVRPYKYMCLRNGRDARADVILLELFEPKKWDIFPIASFDENGYLLDRDTKKPLINAKDTIIAEDMNEKEFVDETIVQWEIDFPIKKVLKLKKCTIDWDAVFGNDEE